MKKCIFVSALRRVLLFGCYASKYEYLHMYENYKIGNYAENVVGVGNSISSIEDDYRKIIWSDERRA